MSPVSRPLAVILAVALLAAFALTVWAGTRDTAAGGKLAASKHPHERAKGGDDARDHRDARGGKGMSPAAWTREGEGTRSANQSPASRGTTVGATASDPGARHASKTGRPSQATPPRSYPVDFRRRYYAEHAHVQRLLWQLHQLRQARHIQAVDPNSTAGTFLVTAYCLTGTTATGAQAGPGSIAVDPSVIPLGSRLYVQGYGYGIADDTGPAVTGRHVDVWIGDCAAAYQATHYGRVTVR